MAFGKRRKKKDKQRAEREAAAALIEVPEPAPSITPAADVAAPAAPVPPAADLFASLAPLAPEPAPPAPPVPAPPVPAPPVPAPPVPAAAPEPPPVRFFADELATPVFSFAPGGPVEAEQPAAPVAAVAPVATAPATPAEPAPQPAALEHSGARTVALPDSDRLLAERMRSSQYEMAQLSMHMDAWMDQAVELRTELIAEWDAEGLRPSYTDLVVRAVARSLIKHPQLNSVVRPQGIELLPTVDVGITTPIDGAFPVLVSEGADRRSLKELVAESARLAAEYSPSSPPAGPAPTFTVASLGAFGVDAFTPIVLTPNVATLGIGRVRDETRWEGDRPVRSSVMTLTLSWDHRALGGSVAAEFLVEVREMLEQPYRLLVG